VIAGVTTVAAEGATGYHHGPVPVAVTTADVVGLWIGLVGAAVLASRRRGSASAATDFGLWIRDWRDVLGGAAVGLASQYLLIPALYWPFEQADPALRQRLSHPAQQDTASAHSVWSIGVLLVVLAVGAPIVEELFFRGLLLRGLLGVAPVPVAVVGSGLLFGLAHFERTQFAGLAAFGIVLGVLAWRTGRLAPGMAAHGAFNAAAVLSVVHLH